MEHDFTWLASELGFPMLEEAQVAVVANAAARSALQAGVDGSLERAAAQLAGTDHGDAELCALVARARAGLRGVGTFGDFGKPRVQVLASPAGPGRARLLFAPEKSENASALQQRAALVDVAAAVSHEVANAVGAIAGWAELGLGANGSAVDPREALGLIASCARTAEQAARRMLSVARGEHEEEDDCTDASELSGELVELLALTARERRVTLSASIEPNLAIPGSRARLFTILWNLTKNAIEASPASAVVSVHLHGDDRSVTLEVRDAGPGLDAVARARIFTPYYTTKTQGTGLGLALVRQAVEALGGSISVDSVLGRGSVFRASLPRVTVQGSADQSTDSTRPESQEAPTGVHILDARVLVVDDDDALREMVATALSLRGARVTTARTSEEARRVEGSFDVALIDMMLDDCRGDELLAQLRKRGNVHAAMLVTGTVQKPKLVPGGEPDDWVRKPFEISHLVDRLRRTLERHRMLSAAAMSMRR